MPSLIPGINTEQKVVTTGNNDVDINASITAEAVDDWMVTLMFIYPDGSQVVILYSRNVTIIS